MSLEILFIFLAIVAFLAYKAGLFSQRKNHGPYKKFRPDLSNPEIALKYVQASQYAVRPVMNKSVYPVFKIIERHFKELNQGHRVIPEMCMGAAPQCVNEEGFSSINSKRIDIGVIDWMGHLILAVEYNGTGHYQGNAAGRDAVKRMALNKARVPLIEIIPDDDENRILEKLAVATTLKN